MISNAKIGDIVWAHVPRENYIEKFKIQSIEEPELDWNHYDCESVDGIGNRSMRADMIYRTEKEAHYSLNSQREIEVNRMYFRLNSKEDIMNELFDCYSFHENHDYHESTAMRKLIKAHFDMEVE